MGSVICDRPAVLRLSSQVSYRLTKGVVVIPDGESLRLLDFNRGRFYALDPVGADLLSLSLSVGGPEAVCRIAAKYSIAESIVRRDLARLVLTLKQKRLIVGERCEQAAPRRSSVVRAGALILNCISVRVVRLLSAPFRRNSSAVDTGGAPHLPCPLFVRFSLIAVGLSLRLFGWGKTIAFLKAWQRESVDDLGVDPKHALKKIDNMICEAAARVVIVPINCKERAVTAYHIFRNLYGLPAEIVVGIRTHPFDAHAWVECQGQTFTDRQEHCELFAEVARFRE